MTRTFVVTAAAEIVRVERAAAQPSGPATGSATFTVKNQANQDHGVVLDVVPVAVTTPEGTSEAGPDWFEVERPTRALAAGASDQVRVDVAVPVGTAVGTYAFVLRAYSSDGVPEETMATSPQVRLRIDEQPASQVPWWVWPLVGVVALTVLIVIGALVISDDGETASPTTTVAPTVPPACADLPLRFEVDDTFAITGRGVVVTGTLQQGALEFDDEIVVDVVAGSERRRTTIRGADRRGTRIEAAVPGDPDGSIGLLLGEVPPNLRRGDLIVEPDADAPARGEPCD